MQESEDRPEVVRESRRTSAVRGLAWALGAAGIATACVAVVVALAARGASGFDAIGYAIFGAGLAVVAAIVTATVVMWRLRVRPAWAPIAALLPAVISLRGFAAVAPVIWFATTAAIVWAGRGHDGWGLIRRWAALLGAIVILAVGTGALERMDERRLHEADVADLDAKLRRIALPLVEAEIQGWYLLRPETRGPGHSPAIYEREAAYHLQYRSYESGHGEENQVIEVAARPPWFDDHPCVWYFLEVKRMTGCEPLGPDRWNTGEGILIERGDTLVFVDGSRHAERFADALRSSTPERLTSAYERFLQHLDSLRG